MPHADEALKELIRKFEAAPASEAFVDLSAALLARGHAAEALTIAEHGLQISPLRVEGRVERAAALLALGRPRVAYVELRRTLAISTGHRRALRLLGRAYKEAGAPERAAELLSQRFGTSEIASSSISIPAESRTKPGLPLPSEPSTLDPNLFSNLTVDLGLGAAVPELPQRRVEITQIIRRKGMPRPPRSASELTSIDGPIVDTTQPGQIVESEEPQTLPPLDAPELTPLFPLDDEPLFHDAAPFEVRPVETSDLGMPDVGSQDTLIEGVEENPGFNAAASEDLMPDVADLGLDDPRTSIRSPRPPIPPGLDTLADEPAPDLNATLTDVPIAPPPAARPTEPMVPMRPQPALTPDMERTTEEPAVDASPTAVLPPGNPLTSSLGVVAVERARAVEGRIRVVTPRPSAGRVALALVAAALMLGYLGALAVAGSESLAVWWSANPYRALEAPTEGTQSGAETASSVEP